MRSSLLIVLFFFGYGVSAQTHVLIEGVVHDVSTGEPVPFASIGVEGSPLGTSSNTLGEFSLQVPSAMLGQKLKISCVGFESATVSIQNSRLEVQLKPGKTMLKEVLILGGDLRPEKIVKKAFSRIKKNYYTKPFVYKAFYRHYCKDDSVYGRLIEAAVDIYKTKGHRWQAPRPGVKEEVRVTQLRRSLDSTRVVENHAPIALYSVMAPDIVSYQGVNNVENGFWAIAYGVSWLRARQKTYDYNLDGITELDGELVYRVKFKSNTEAVTLGVGLSFKRPEEGTLFIHAKNFAIVRSEWSYFVPDTTRIVSTYRKIGEKYFWNHTSTNGLGYSPQKKFRHQYHLDLMANEVQVKGFKKFKGKEPDREELQKVPYDSNFWNNYTILKSTPLEDKIVADLGGNRSLNKQFVIFDSLEKKNYSRERIDEKRFEQFRLASKNSRILFIDFWASWCAPCIGEMVFEKRLLKKYAGKITFVLLSIDKDEQRWKQAIAKYKLGLAGFVHYRIGPESDLAKFFDVSSIPHYALIRKNGEFYDLNAKRPSDPLLEQDLDALIKEAEAAEH